MNMIYNFEDFLNEEIKYDNDNGEKFWGNFGAGVLPYSRRTGKFLINYRSEHVNEPHTWGIWGGKIDNDENIEEAVKREFKEESGYDKNIVLFPAYVFENENGKFKYYNFIGVIEDEFTPELDWESEDYKWVDKDELFNHENKHFGLENLLKDYDTYKIIDNIVDIFLQHMADTFKKIYNPIDIMGAQHPLFEIKKADLDLMIGDNKQFDNEHFYSNDSTYYITFDNSYIYLLLEIQILDNRFHQTYKLINHKIADMSFDLTNKEETHKLIEKFEKNYKKNRTVSNFNL